MIKKERMEELALLGGTPAFAEKLAVQACKARKPHENASAPGAMSPKM